VYNLCGDWSQDALPKINGFNEELTKKDGTAPLYEYIAPDGKRYPADLATLRQWAREGRISPLSKLRDLNTGCYMPASVVVPPLPNRPAGSVALPQAKAKGLGAAKFFGYILATYGWFIFAYGALVCCIDPKGANACFPCAGFLLVPAWLLLRGADGLFPFSLKFVKASEE
jgi:hypothetical protein